jgi:predicted MFS family arabinose efflux permease
MLVIRHPARRLVALATPSRRLPSQVSLYLFASLVVTFLAASAAPTPLYATYQAEWGFSAITTTIVFGVYAIAVLAALLTLGRLSDHLGRRPVLLAAIAVQALSLVLFVHAGDVDELLVARVVQGVSAGAALGAIGAGMLDLNRSRGTLANAVAPGIGTATGALLSAIVVQYLPAPTRLIYLVLLTVLAVQAVGVFLTRETVTRTDGALAALVPDVRLPRGVRGAVLMVAPVLFAVWALAGFYASLGPALVRSIAGSHSIVLGGLSLFVLAGSAALSVLVLRAAEARTLMVTGVLALVLGVTMTLVAVAADSTVGFFAGTVVAGVGFGSGFQGGIRTVLPLVAPHERAGVLSLLYVVSYLGLGVPAIAAGYLVVHAGGLVVTAREYGIAVIALAAVALVALLRRGDAGEQPQRANAPACTAGRVR